MASVPALPLAWPATWRVLAREVENHDTVTLGIAPLAGAPPAFAPGQFNMLYVPGRGEVAISLSGDPATAHHRVHTVRAVGAATRALTALHAGAELGVRGPFGHGWPLGEALARPVVVVAGGIGLAPLRPLLLALAARAAARAAAGLPTVLYYGARAPAERIFVRQLDTWARLPGFTVMSTVDQAERDWQGAVGLVTSLMQASLPARTLGLLCGPEIMMRFAARRLQAQGLAARDIVVSLERNMKCAVGSCGHCQFGARFLCRDGPVFGWHEVETALGVREL